MNGGGWAAGLGFLTIFLGLFALSAPFYTTVYVVMIAIFGAGSFVAQIGSITVVGVYTIVVTAILVLLAKAVVGMRVDDETEITGLDLAQHGERAYDVTS